MQYCHNTSVLKDIHPEETGPRISDNIAGVGSSRSDVNVEGEKRIRHGAGRAGTADDGGKD